MLGAFARGEGFDGRNLAVLLVWGVLGAVVAVRRFRWEPRSG